MIEIQGDFWEYAKKADAICCTINTTLKYDNLLIMGAGIAKQFAQQYPFLQKDWGDRIGGWTKADKP